MVYSMTQRERRDGKALLALTCAILGLVGASLEYAGLFGDTCVSEELGRATAEEVLDGVTFAFSFISLLYAIFLLVMQTDSHRIALVHSKFLFCVVVPSLTTFFLVAGAQDLRQLRSLGGHEAR